MTSVFSRVKEILIVCKLMVNPRASIVVSQPVLFLGAKIGVAPVSPGPNNARGLRLARPNRVTQSCHGPNVVPASVDSRPRTRWRRKGRTPPPRYALILASSGTGVGFPFSQRSTILTWAIMSIPSSSNWAVFLWCYWARSAAADITPQNPGNPDHPMARRKSITTNPPTV